MYSLRGEYFTYNKIDGWKRYEDRTTPLQELFLYG